MLEWPLPLPLTLSLINDNLINNLSAFNHLLFCEKFLVLLDIIHKISAVILNKNPITKIKM